MRLCCITAMPLCGVMHDLFHVHGIFPDWYVRGPAGCICCLQNDMSSNETWFYVCLVVWFYRGPSVCKADDCNCLTARTDYLLLTTGPDDCTTV